MRLRFFVLILGIFCLAGRASAQSPENYHVEIGYEFWKPEPEIVITSGSLATPVDFINTFPFDKDRFREFRIVLKPARGQKIRFTRVPIEYTGTAPLPQPIRFNGQTFGAGVETTAQLNWTLTTLGYEWDPVAGDKGYVGLLTSVKFNKMDAQLSATNPIAITQTFERTVPIPTIGASARGYLGQSFSVTGDFTLLRVGVGDVSGKFFDVDIYGTLNIGRNVGVQFGYRHITADYDVDDDTGSMKLKGTYFGGVLRY